MQAETRFSNICNQFHTQFIGFVYYTFDFFSKIEKRCYIFIYKIVFSYLKIHTNDVCRHCLFKPSAVSFLYYSFWLL